jgi:hypothetical protein
MHESKMTPALKTAIANLYVTFSHYPFRPEIDGCPHCVSAEDQKKLAAKALNLMESEDISRYSWKAMTTWGEVEDFKHFLPRLLELIATTGIAYNSGVVLRKLEYAKWNDWEQAEKDSTHSFLLAWWTESITEKDGLILYEFVDMYNVLGGVDPLLKHWVIDFEDCSFRNLVWFIQSNYYDLLGKKSYFKEFDQASINKLLSWIIEKKDLLEQGFYHFETTDPEFAKEISDTLYILDWVPWPE